MVVFDLTDHDSFVNIDGWLTEIEKHCGTDVSVIVLANKCDVAQKEPDSGNKDYEDEDDQEREIEVTDEEIAKFE